MPRPLFLSGAILLLQATVAISIETENGFSEERFERTVAPLLVRYCVECHQGSDPSGGLLLTTREGLRQGGDSGAVIDTDAPANSYLLERVMAGEMPPESAPSNLKPTESEIAVLKHWIEAGAVWPKERLLDFFERTNAVRAGRDWWSLQPVVRPNVPQATSGNQPHSAIDAFVRDGLARAGMKPAEKAHPAVRIRRLHHVLTGLPPSQVAIDAFVANPTDDAWERIVDRLLASPQYGVRWARHWLDVVRYADTSGYERDQEKPFAWKYRDWVVDAFNSDMPYDQFVVQQLAGDEMVNRTEASVIATGFLRLGTWNDEPNDPKDYVYDRLEDLVHTTSTAFLAMTVKCARCHSHKFDPITQEDYYRMASIFWVGPVHRTSNLGGPKPEELRITDVLGWTDVAERGPPIRLLKNGERTKPLHVVSPATLSMLPSLQRPLSPPEHSKETTHRRLQYAAWITDRENPLASRVLVNRLWQHHFGKAIVRSPNNFGFLADAPTHPAMLDWLAAEFVQSGWRLKYLHKLIVMSETWQQASTHELSENYERTDAANRYWWRAERRRLDADTLRDRMLEASGELDLRLGGAGFRPPISAEALEGLSRKSAAWTASPPSEQNRRSLYMFVKRGLLPPMMTTFDFCETTQPCGKRDSTTVPTQALTLLNNPFVHERSRVLALRATARTDELIEQINFLWSSVLRRPPKDHERQLAKRHVIRQRQLVTNETATGTEEALLSSANVTALASLAHVLLNSNEFLYVD